MKVVTNALLVALFSLIIVGESFGQIVMQDGVVFTCGEKFYDTGDVGGNYSSNENLTLTICPDEAGGRTSVTFNSFDSQVGVDRLTVYNANGAVGPIDQFIDGGDAFPLTVTATNETGCLTFVWNSDASIVDGGWDADISCAPCHAVEPILVSSTPAINGSNIIGVCEGATVTLSGDLDEQADPSPYNQDKSKSTYYWDMGDGNVKPAGNVATHTYAQPGIYFANLMILDNAGCRNTVLLNQEIHVTGDGVFTGTTPDQIICQGEHVDLTGNAETTTISNERVVTNNTDSVIADGVAQSIYSNIEVNAFPTAEVYSVGDIERINLSLHHGSTDDIIVFLTAPNGVSMKLHDRAAGWAAILGAEPNTPWNYSFSPNGTQTWADEAVAAIDIPEGDYKPIDAFPTLNGTPLNGTWTLTIADYLGNGVDGLLDSWSIDFNPSVFASAPSYKPGKLSDDWLSDATIILPPTGNTIRVQPSSDKTYTFVLTDEYNCKSDTTIDVNVEEPPVAGADATDDICGDGSYDLPSYLSGQDNTSNTGYWEEDPANPESRLVIGAAPYDVPGAAAFNAGGLSTGTYVFWYIQGASACDNDTAFVTLNVTKDPNPGGSDSEIVCENEEPIVIFGVLLGANKDTIGVWSGPQVGALQDPNQYDTELDVSLLPGPGSYDFTYTIDTPPCAPKSATVTIVVNENFDPGTDGEEVVCSTAPSYDLYDAIGGEELGGEWFLEDGTRPAYMSNGPEFNTITPTAMANGEYVFIYRINDGTICEYDTAFATITISDVPAEGATTTVEFCTSDNTVYKLYNLNGADPGGEWTDNDGSAPAYSANDTTFNPSLDASAPADYPVTYTYDHEQSAAGCPARNATLSIIVHRQPDAGTSGNKAICEDEDAFDMFGELGGTPQPENGTWNVQSRPELDNGIVGGPEGDAFRFDALSQVQPPESDLLPGSTIILNYTVAATGGGCTDASASVIVEVSKLHDAGNPSPFTVCGDNPNVSLFDAFLVGDEPTTTGGVWSDVNYPLTATPPNPQYSSWLSGPGYATLSAQNAEDSVHTFRYTISTNGCPDQTETVKVTIDKVPFAGADSIVYFCETESIVPLFDQLGIRDGEPHAGGTWVSMAGNPCTGACGFGGANFAPNAVDCGNSYNFVYTKTSDFGQCTPDQATVTVNVVCNPNPGQGPGVKVPVCRNSSSLSLFDLLTNSPDIGGTWSDDDNTGALSSDLPGNYLATFNPSLSPDGFGEPDDYQFTYTVDNGYCDPKSTIITVSVYKDPYAGDDAAINVCETTCNINLYAQLGTSLGTPKTGGTWEDVDGSGALGGSNFNPCLAVANNGPGTYRFRYKVNLGVPALVGTQCYEDEAIVTITVVKTPEAGSDGEIYACISDNEVPLFPEISVGVTADAGGVWAAPPGFEACISQDGKINPQCIGAPGDYIFTYTVKNAPCPQDQSEVLVHIEEIPSSGDDNTVTVCVSSAPYNMYNGVGGNPHPNGTFTAVPDCNGCIGAGNFFSPNVAGVGTYTIQYQAENNTCAATDFSTLTIIVEDLGNPGEDSTVVACINNSSLDLQPLLGGSANIDPGVWSTVNPPSTPLFGGQYVNCILQGAITKSYKYTVTPVACPVVTSEVTVQVNDLPVAGEDGEAVACITDQAFKLLEVIDGEDAGGVWTTPTGTNGLNDPTLDATQAGIGVHRFEYTVSTEACPDDVSVAIVEILPLNDAGQDGEITVCASQTTLDLNDVITDEDIDGTWDEITLPAIALSENIMSPSAAGPSPVNGWQIQYTADNGACPQDQSIATIHVVKVPVTGGNGEVIVCETDNAFDLKDYLTPPFDEPSTGALWTDLDGSGGLVGAASGTFNPSDAAAASGQGEYKFRYTIDNGVCDPVFSTVTVKLRTLADAGEDAVGYVCEDNSTYNVNNVIGSSAGVGTWTILDKPNGALASSNLSAGGNLDAAGNGMLPGVYEIMYKVPANGCPADSAIATINLVEKISVVSDLGPTANDVVEGHSVKCNTLNNSYQVTFSIKGGAGGYVVDDLSGLNFSETTSAFNGYESYTSALIPSATSPIYEFTVADSIGCGFVTIKGHMQCADNDGDGIADAEDIDDDNDGIPDVLESHYYSELFDTTINIVLDNNFNNRLDFKDPDVCPTGYFINAKGVCSLFDADGDGIINQFDVDSDGDGIYDAIEYTHKENAWLDDFSAGTYDLSGGNDISPKNGMYDDAEQQFIGGPDNKPLPFNSDDDLGMNKKLTADYLDIDSDNDGIPDAIESDGNRSTPTDTDSDGTEDFRDKDSDGDNVEDVFEGLMLGTSATTPNDADSDGIYDFREADSDNDGINDMTERVTTVGETSPPVDTDEDGTFDFQDMDSDNDGLPDVYEGLVNTDGDLDPVYTYTVGGQIQALPLYDYRDKDSDNDKIEDFAEAGFDGTEANDEDEDDTPDFRDLDSDGDGLSDKLEGSVDTTEVGAEGFYLFISDKDDDGVYDFRDTDSDGDGILDTHEGTDRSASSSDGLVYVAEDHDEDGEPNFRDIDSDGDDIPDANEGTVIGDWGVVQYLEDIDGDTEPNYLDIDSDNDSIPDAVEAGFNPNEPANSDDDELDGVPLHDYRDTDSDNDGIDDIVEGTGDCDSDGTPNYRDFGDNCRIEIEEIAEGFSPNGDEVNDRWKIKDIERYQDNNVKIYNRWGVLVYEKSGYTNDNAWDGTANDPLYGEEELPVGTYFFLLDLGIDQEPQRGYVYLNR